MFTPLKSSRRLAYSCSKCSEEEELGWDPMGMRQPPDARELGGTRQCEKSERQSQTDLGWDPGSAFQQLCRLAKLCKFFKVSIYL